MDGLQVSLDDLLRMNTIAFSRNVVSEIAVTETLRKPLSTEGAEKRADAIAAQAILTCNRMEESGIALMFENVPGFVDTLIPCYKTRS